ncbi:MAG: histidinol-phosphate transaminase [Clostridia bacterium]
MQNINHGANLYDLSKKYGFSKNELMDFSSNINPFGSSKLAKDYVINNIDMVSIYPDSSYMTLKSSISSYCNCFNENIIVGSGATELISSFIQTLNPKKSLLIVPVYSEYEKELKKINCDIVKYFSASQDNFRIDINNLINKINNDSYDLVIICNPNNPTGFTFSKDEIEKLLKNTSSFVMIDETYIEFTNTEIYSSSSLIDTYNNLFVIRGTSKFFSTPGIRLGYGLISDKNIKESINSNLDLWNVNIFASMMGEVMFTDKDFIANTHDLIIKERNYLIKELNSINNLKVYDTQGNFILCKIQSNLITAKDLRDKLIPNKIIIRDCSSFEGLNEFFFRVCILKPNENKLLIDSINKALIDYTLSIE